MVTLVEVVLLDWFLECLRLLHEHILRQLEGLLGLLWILLLLANQLVAKLLLVVHIGELL